MELQRIAFRTDANSQIGTGHFMRCLTLANALKQRGAKIRFVSHHLPEHLSSMLVAKEHEFVPLNRAQTHVTLDELAHAQWLGSSQATDAQATIQALSGQFWDWLIVDHYALDFRWERLLTSCFSKLMVIDDLVDRTHICDMLLDQTFERDSGDYQAWVPSNCQLLCGSQYALLRPEFATLREHSLIRRQSPQLKHLLIAMGGTDPHNATSRVLKTLDACSDALPFDCRISIVLGASAPWLSNVQKLAKNLPWPSTVLVNVTDMATLMADSDLAIGAAGATSWERCCMGLPTVMLSLADNQLVIASKLQEARAAILVDFYAANFKERLCESIRETVNLNTMQRVSEKSSVICDGLGVARVLEAMGEK